MHQISTLVIPIDGGGRIVRVGISKGGTKFLYTMKLVPPTNSRKHCSSTYYALKTSFIENTNIIHNIHTMHTRIKFLLYYMSSHKVKMVEVPTMCSLQKWNSVIRWSTFMLTSMSLQTNFIYINPTNIEHASIFLKFMVNEYACIQQFSSTP